MYVPHKCFVTATWRISDASVFVLIRRRYEKRVDDAPHIRHTYVTDMKACRAYDMVTRHIKDIYALDVRSP